MKNIYHTVRETYLDDDYNTHDRAIWTFTKEASANELINLLSQHNDHNGDLYIDSWSE